MGAFSGDGAGVAARKVTQAAEKYKAGNPPKEGIGFFYHMAGLFGQRLYFYNKTKTYFDKLKIDARKCVACGKCGGLYRLNKRRESAKIEVLVFQ